MEDLTLVSSAAFSIAFAIIGFALTALAFAQMRPARVRARRDWRA